MKKIVALLIVLLLAFTGCGKSSELLDGLNELQSGLADAADEIEGLSIENIGDGEVTAAGETEDGEVSEEEGQGWPDGMPSDIPELKGVTIEGFAQDSQNFLINFSVEESQKQILLDYIDALEADGYTEDSTVENKFGFDYSGHSDKYTVFFNIGFGGLSKVHFMIK